MEGEQGTTSPQSQCAGFSCQICVVAQLHNDCSNWTWSRSLFWWLGDWDDCVVRTITCHLKLTTMILLVRDEVFRSC